MNYLLHRKPLTTQRIPIDLEFDNFLKKHGFLVTTEFKSKSIATRASMPSIFNFDLHRSLDIDNLTRVNRDGLDLLFTKNLLVDSLNKKKVKSYSYGLLPFENGINQDGFLYLWEEEKNIGFLKSFFKYRTLIRRILHGLHRVSVDIDQFRENSIHTLQKIEISENSFYYFHFYLPHNPFTYFKIYPNPVYNYMGLSTEEYLSEYIRYKRWSLDKIKNTLTDPRFSEARIIITGDHGLKSIVMQGVIDPKLTSLYTKGYLESDISKVNFVQDLGYLNTRFILKKYMQVQFIPPPDFISYFYGVVV